MLILLSIVTCGVGWYLGKGTWVAARLVRESLELGPVSWGMKLFLFTVVFLISMLFWPWVQRALRY